MFLLVRQVLVPKTFGQFGHYRASVLEEIRNTPVKYAGQELCAACHTDVAETRQAGRHKGVACEACHGPLAGHATDPANKPTKPEATPLCVNCHERDAAKPAWFKQVAVKAHYGGENCTGCHQPHKPGM